MDMLALRVLICLVSQVTCYTSPSSYSNYYFTIKTSDVIGSETTNDVLLQLKTPTQLVDVGALNSLPTLTTPPIFQVGKEDTFIWIQQGAVTDITSISLRLTYVIDGDNAGYEPWVLQYVKLLQEDVSFPSIREEWYFPCECGLFDGNAMVIHASPEMPPTTQAAMLTTATIPLPAPPVGSNIYERHFKNAILYDPSGVVSEKSAIVMSTARCCTLQCAALCNKSAASPCNSFQLRPSGKICFCELVYVNQLPTVMLSITENGSSYYVAKY